MNEYMECHINIYGFFQLSLHEVSYEHIPVRAWAYTEMPVQCTHTVYIMPYISHTDIFTTLD